MDSMKGSVMDMINDLAAQVKQNGKVVTPEPEKPAKDGIDCQRCGNTGWVAITRDDGTVAMAHCPDCFERRQVAHRLRTSGISPKDYERYTLVSFDERRSETAKRMKDMAEAWLKGHTPGGTGFGLFGRSGMGKTHICIAVCQELTRRFGEPHFYFSYRAEIPSLVKASRSYSDDYDAAMRKWKTCQNLYIDDLFKFSGRVESGKLVAINRDELKVVFDLINARYLNHLTTIFSNEYSVGNLARIDEALGSRIYEMVNPYALRVDGQNQRLAGLG